MTALLYPELLTRIASLRLLGMDVDGVLTSGHITLYYPPDAPQGKSEPATDATQDYTEIKAFHVHDGLGIQRLQNAGVEVAWITARASKSVAYRAKELGVSHVFQNCQDKQYTLAELAQKLAIDTKQVGYVGDDLPDLKALQWCGTAFSVANAVPRVQRAAHWVTQRSGGEGAIREICDLILLAQQKSL